MECCGSLRSVPAGDLTDRMSAGGAVVLAVYGASSKQYVTKCRHMLVTGVELGSFLCGSLIID
jgi:hypothetical protein